MLAEKTEERARFYGVDVAVNVDDYLALERRPQRHKNELSSKPPIFIFGTLHGLLTCEPRSLEEVEHLAECYSSSLRT